MAKIQRIKSKKQNQQNQKSQTKYPIKPDWKSWSKKPIISLEEGAYLLLSHDPKYPIVQSILSSENRKPIGEKYEEIIDLAKRAIKAGELKTYGTVIYKRLIPRELEFRKNVFFIWADKIGLLKSKKIKNLLKILEDKNPDNPPKLTDQSEILIKEPDETETPHGNTINNLEKKVRVLQAAIVVLARHPEDFVDKKKENKRVYVAKITGEKILQSIKKNIDYFIVNASSGEDKEFILKNRTMKNYINEAFSEVRKSDAE